MKSQLKRTLYPLLAASCLCITYVGCTEEDANNNESPTNPDMSLIEDMTSEDISEDQATDLMMNDAATHPDLPVDMGSEPDMEQDAVEDQEIETDVPIDMEQDEGSEPDMLADIVDEPDAPVDMGDEPDMLADMPEDMEQDEGLEPDMSDDMSPDIDEDIDEDMGEDPIDVIRGRFESAGGLRTCGSLLRWDAPDGVLLRATMDLCGDDINALVATIVANLDAAALRGKRVMLALLQGTNLPDSWLANCETYTLDTARFAGDICLPWDNNYQASLGSALTRMGQALENHPALAGVYFTTPTMTNGVEFHWRVDRATFPYPGDEIFHQSYKDIMDLFQGAFDKAVVFEGGHCLWARDHDCELPSTLYHYTRDTYGVDKAGIALWNCAERFWAGDGSGAETFGTKDLLEEVSRDGASLGCQTVGSFTQGACRFSDTDVGDYGPRGDVLGDNCPEDPAFDPAGACVDTLRWFAGVEAQGDPSAQIQGTWVEGWTRDITGVYETSPECRAALNFFAPELTE